MWSGQSMFAHLQSSSSVADDFNRTHHNSRFVSGLAEIVHNNNMGHRMEQSDCYWCRWVGGVCKCCVGAIIPVNIEHLRC